MGTVGVGWIGVARGRGGGRVVIRWGPHVINILLYPLSHMFPVIPLGGHNEVGGNNEISQASYFYINTPPPLLAAMATAVVATTPARLLHHTLVSVSRHLCGHVSLHPTLYSLRGAFDAVGGVVATDGTIGQMVEAATRYCPFSDVCLQHGLAERSA
uniref:Uncharacterized protein n=1 Tax=Oryza glumipatula TaxID=40148 RepID=A0A0D9YW81_9ORYZ